MSTNDKLEREVAVLCDLPRDELIARWVRAYGCQPPKAVKRELFERAAAWHLQAKRLGGLSTAARRAIRESLNSTPRRSPGDDTAGRRSSGLVTATVASAAPRPGTRLMREWNGRIHAVDVTDEGFMFDGKSYRSLSAIARRITGAQWSGPRFFGL